MKIWARSKQLPINRVGHWVWEEAKAKAKKWLHHLVYSFGLIYGFIASLTEMWGGIRITSSYGAISKPAVRLKWIWDRQRYVHGTRKRSCQLNQCPALMRGPDLQWTSIISWHFWGLVPVWTRSILSMTASAAWTLSTPDCVKLETYEYIALILKQCNQWSKKPLNVRLPTWEGYLPASDNYKELKLTKVALKRSLSE